jgi:ethanolamine utilization microcompartment shell protein EutL
MSVGTDDIIDNAVTDAKLSLDSIYTVWRESLGVDNLSRILFKRNTISFDPSIIVSHNGSFNKTDVAVSGNNVYVVSRENITEPPASDAIWYRRSTDGGASFSGAVNLRTTTTGSMFEPSLTASGNNVYVVWDDDGTASQGSDVLYRRSTDGGASFGSTVNLTENTAADAEETAMAASGNNVYVFWSNFVTGSSSDILYKKSTNGGTSFGDTKNLSNTAGSSREPAVAVSGNNVYVVWRERDSTSGNQEILYRRSTNGGASFSGAVNLSNSIGLSQLPAIAASGNNVYVVWQDDSLVPGTSDILYKKSTNGGASFGDTKNLSNNAGNSGSPAIAASGNNVYVVWHDNTTQAAGAQFDILYRKSTNGGANFGSTVNLSNTAQASTIPAIAASNNLT